MILTKYHGCGNDFIILPYNADYSETMMAQFVQEVCDRHTGIGADGCIFVKKNPLEMIFYNCDGSRAPMCGNGIRCFAKYCCDEGIVNDTQFDVITLAGVKHIEILNMDPFQVKVKMGSPIFDNAYIHVDDTLHLLNYPLEIEGRIYPIYSFFMTTVHTVIFIDDDFKENIETIGQKICFHEIFKEKTNVNFVYIVDDHTLKVQTYERGVGMTLACGSGVCASAYMAYKVKNCKNGLDITLEKGALHVDINDQDEVFMSGPAQRIMKGEYYEIKS